MWFVLTYIAIVLLVIEIAVVLMRSTGLKYEIARFQVISLLTSTGFTTKESELILGHPIRRRLGMFLILFGVFSLAVIISSISSILVPNFRISYLAFVPIVLAVILLLLRLPVIDPLLKNKFNLTLEKKFEIHELPLKDVLLHSEEDAFVDIPIGQKSSHAGHTLRMLCRTEILRKNRLETSLEPGDILYLYGDRQVIDRSFYNELKDKENLLQDEKTPYPG